MILSESTIEKVLNEALSTGADFAEIFAEDSYSSQLSLVDSTPSAAVVGRMYGAGIRVHFGFEEIYVTTNDLSESSLLKCAKAAAQVKKGSPKIKSAHIESPKKDFDSTHTYGKMPWEIEREQKFKFLKSLDKSSRAQSSKVTQVEPTLVEKVQNIQVANSLGVNVTDTRQNYRTNLTLYVEDQGVKESYGNNEWSTVNSLYYQEFDNESLVKRTVDSAEVLLKAKPAPAGEMPVIIQNGFGGVIFHEACGHGLETTAVAKDASVFCNKLGERIAPDCVTAIDDGTIEGGWGTLKYDDEGQLTKKTTLIENGILKSYMVDQLGAKKTNYAITGSGRRESYKYAPTSRMRNTYLAAGTTPLESMISNIDYGIYCKDMGGGSVSPGTGDFNFNARESYMIRNGKLAEPVKGASLIGRGIDTLSKITHVSNNLKLASGMCGSESGSIPAAVGQPAILVSNILVGGKA